MSTSPSTGADLLDRLAAQNLSNDEPGADADALLRELLVQPRGTRAGHAVPRRRLARPRYLVPAALAVAGLLTVGAISLPRQVGGAVPAYASIAELAAATALEDDVVLGPNEVLYVKTEAFDDRRTTGTTLEQWQHHNGDVWIRSSEGAADFGVGTSADPLSSPYQKEGSLIRLEPGAGKYPGTYDFQRTLTTDPAALRAWILAFGMNADGKAADTLFTAVADILRAGTAPPRLRAALLEIARGLPGVRFDAHTKDSLGRDSVTISRQQDDQPYVRNELVFDVRTTNLVEERTVTLANPFGERAGKTDITTLVRVAPVSGDKVLPD